MRARTVGRSLLVVLLLVLAAAIFAPWQKFIERKIVAAMEAKGIAPVTLAIDHIGLRGLVLKDIALGEPPLKLTTLTVGYHARALLDGQIEAVEVSGLTMQASQTDAGWQVEGLENLLRSKSPEKTPTIPVTAAELNALPFSQVDIRESTLTLAGKGWKATLPITLMLQHGHAPSLAMRSDAITIQMGADTVSIAALKIDLALDEATQQWRGTWSVNDIAVDSESFAAPKLTASGELTVSHDALHITGGMASEDKTYSVGFNADYSLSDAAASQVTMTKAHIPMSGGTMSVAKVSIPLASKKPIAFTAHFEKMATDTLMSVMTGSHATATGTVSGDVPLTISRDGAVRVGKSALSADAPGTIALAPEAIPGDNPQVALVRDVLKNLHYTVLAVGLDMAPDGTLAATLAVEGKNPDVEKGRPIKLQVHLSGDLLNLILQNMKLMTDPKTFIEQNTHETP